MSYRAKYQSLLEAIAKEAEAISMKYFRTDGIGAERKRDGSVVTKADKAIEAMAIAKVAASGLAIDVVGEETTAKCPRAQRRTGARG